MTKKTFTFLFVFSLLLAQAAYGLDVPAPVEKAIQESEYLQGCGRVTITGPPLTPTYDAMCGNVCYINQLTAKFKPNGDLYFIYPWTPRAYKRVFNLYMKNGKYQEALKLLEMLENSPVRGFSFPSFPDEITLYNLFTLFNVTEKNEKIDRLIIEYLNKTIKTLETPGIGVEIMYGGCNKIVEIIKGSPAEKEGLKEGDVIVKINGNKLKGMDSEKIKSLLTGQEGEVRELVIERAGEEFKKSVTLAKPNSPDLLSLALSLRSLQYRLIGELELSRQDAERSYNLSPNMDLAKDALAMVYIDKEKNNDVIKMFSNTKYKDYFASVLEATAYAKTGNYKKALDIYSSIPWEHLPSKSGLRQVTINNFLKSMEPYIDIKKNTAKSLESKGLHREALNEYAEALKLSDEKKAKEIRSEIGYLIKKNPYLSVIPEEARKYALRGEVMLKDGKFEEALKEYKTAIKIAPYIAVLYRTTALVYGELKDYTQAISHMNIYLELMPDAPDSRAVKDQMYKWEFMLEKEKGGK